MFRGNMKNDGLDHNNNPMAVNNNNNNKNNGGNNMRYTGANNQLYTNIPQNITPMDMGNQMQYKNTPSGYNMGSNIPMNYSGGSPMGGFQNQAQMQPDLGLQQMNFSGGQSFNQRPFTPAMPMNGGFPGSMYPYPPAPVYPPCPYGGGSYNMWNSPYSSPTNIPVDGFSNDFGGDFKILGYNSAPCQDGNQNSSMSQQKLTGSNFNNSGKNSRMGN